MLDFSLINFLIIILINLIGSWLIFLVYFANPRNRINQSIVFWIISTLLYVDFGFLANSPILIEYSLEFTRLRFLAVSMFFITGYYFCNNFPIRSKKNIYLDFFYFTIWSIMLIISIFTPLIIEKTEVLNYNVNVIFGHGIILYFIWTIFSIFSIFFILFKKYFKLSEENKLKVQYFLIGAVLFAVLNLLFNIIIPLYKKSMQYYQFGDYSAIFLLGFTAYAIVKRELFDIKIVLTSIFVALIAILLALDAFLSTDVFSIQILKGAVLIIFLIFGHMLIKSVFGEVRRREEVEKLSRAKSEFISMASHQLRTPLTAIKGYSSLMLEETYGKLVGKQKKVLKNIFTSSERLIKIVNDLLNLSRIELGKIEVEKEPVKIEKLVESVCQETKPQAQEKGIKLIWQKPKQVLPEINIDPLKIRQAIFNLIDNAIKYTERGKIEIRVEKAPSKIQIIISDTGMGFTEDEKHRLFELFVRGEAGIDTFVEGTGIGLNVARKFVELHNGKIRAESLGKGKGATFYIELPVR